MTEKQFEYIWKICPQTVEVGPVRKGKSKYEIKLFQMKKKLLTLPQRITQNFIKYGKAWQSWCRYGDMIARNNAIAEQVYDFRGNDGLEEERAKVRKEMDKILDALCKQLDEINWGNWEENKEG